MAVVSPSFDRSFLEDIGRVRCEEYELVGHGEVTNSRCGEFSGRFEGCDRVDLHNKTIMGKDGNLVNCKGKVYIRKRIYYTCHNPRCPVCYEDGWGNRQARNIQTRLKESSKHFGKVEHIIISVPKSDYYLNMEELRVKVYGILREVGVVGGCVIAHGFRFKGGKYWSPHFHVLGHILGGYRKCRRCKRRSNCLRGCDGFDDRAWWIGHEKYGYIVKVADPLHERKNVFGTARYQLSHASIKKGVKRYHVVTWFGCCSYRKLKVTPEIRKEFCPICLHELRRDIVYNGLNEEYFRNNHDFKRQPFVDYVEGVDNERVSGVAWIRSPKKSKRDYLQELTVRDVNVYPVSIDEAFRVRSASVSERDADSID